MASVDDLTNASGSAYGCVIKTHVSDAALYEFQLVKWTAGLATPGTVLATETFTLGAGVTCAIQFEWYVDMTVLGGCQLTASRGTATDYSDLVQKHALVDTSTPLQVTVGEGPLLALSAGSSDTIVLHDQTSLTQIITG
jgi:hypothetical protein